MRRSKPAVNNSQSSCRVITNFDQTGAKKCYVPSDWLKFATTANSSQLCRFRGTASVSVTTGHDFFKLFFRLVIVFILKYFTSS